LPDRVGNAEAEAILPHSFAEKLRPTGPDGVWRDWTTLQFPIFSDAADGWQCRPLARRRCAAAETCSDRSGKAVLRSRTAASAWQLGTVSAPRDPIVAAFTDLMEQDE